jgi:hypothetical protein
VVAEPAIADTMRAGDLRVVISPPPYTGRPMVAMINPSVVTVVEESRVRLETAFDGGPVHLTAGPASMPFVAAAEGWVHEFTATESLVLLMRRPEVADVNAADRLLQVQVEPDRRPIVQIRTPARDLIFGEPRGRVPVTIDARDDIGLAWLALRYTRVSGSGESFTFEEGDVPLRVSRTSEDAWRAEATLSLEQLALQDGDTLVYRAIAADRKPGADPAASESFLIEVGRLAGVASTGFAVPEERDRQGISQQMLIIKTERLHAARQTLSAEAFLEESQMLAIEQRMVRAEFVFMTGGDVHDEVEEAEHSHELAEGRMENSAQVELLAAIREMSRAEARLNAAETAEALVYERAALRALQRAFDRRRYLLRTLPERARIDPSRRLTGDRATARSSRRTPPVAPEDLGAAAARQVMQDLGTAISRQEGLHAALASRVMAVAPSDEPLQQAAIALSSAGTVEARVAAAREAQRLLMERLRATLPPGGRGQIRHDPLAGRVADQSPRGGGPR